MRFLSPGVLVWVGLGFGGLVLGVVRFFGVDVVLSMVGWWGLTGVLWGGFFCWNRSVVVLRWRMGRWWCWVVGLRVCLCGGLGGDCGWEEGCCLCVVAVVVGGGVVLCV